jgi:hypothetical protein
MVHDLLVETAAGGTVPWAGVVFSRRARGVGTVPEKAEWFTTCWWKRQPGGQSLGRAWFFPDGRWGGDSPREG